MSDNFIFGDLTGIDLSDSEELVLSNDDKPRKIKNQTSTCIQQLSYVPASAYSVIPSTGPAIERIFTVKQAAAILQIRTETILRKIYAGELKAFKVGRVWRFKQSQIDDYVSKNTSNFDIKQD